MRCAGLRRPVFASNYDDFAAIEVGAVWITNRLDPTNAVASKFMAQITLVAQQLKMQLDARNDPADEETANVFEGSTNFGRTIGKRDW